MKSMKLKQSRFLKVSLLCALDLDRPRCVSPSPRLPVAASPRQLLNNHNYPDGRGDRSDDQRPADTFELFGGRRVQHQIP